MAVDRIFGCRGKIVADVGADTGRSPSDLARVASVVVGPEPWSPMRTFAARKLGPLGSRNVAFGKGVVERIPFPPNSADAVVGSAGFPFWFAHAGERGRRRGERFLADRERIVRSGGHVVVDGAPG